MSGPAELVLAVIGGADLCLKYGKKLVRLYHAFKDSDDHVQSSILFVEAMWNKMEVQLSYLKRVLGTMRDEHLIVQQNILQMLQSKMLAAITKLESVQKVSGAQSEKPQGIKKWKYLFVKDSLDEAITELDRWQRTFDPTWFLVLRIADNTIDTELSSEIASQVTLNRASTPDSKLNTVRNLRETINGDDSNFHVTLPEDGLEWSAARRIPYADSQLVRHRKTDKTYIADTSSSDTDTLLINLRKDTKRLATRLREIDPLTFSLLACRGLTKRKNHETGKLEHIDLLFQIPAGTTSQEPVSLRRHLLESDNFSLNEVLSLARQLVRAVSFIHTCDFVHKNIRPETVLLFWTESLPPGTVRRGADALSAFLVGFDSFRSTGSNTLRLGDNRWERNLYRHPTRQGRDDNAIYVMQHDVYSLGVCLLELGLRKSFVQYRTEAMEETEAATATLDKVSCFPSNDLGMASDETQSDKKEERAVALKNHLVDMARSKLPKCMGDRYTAVVLTCLTCLDDDNVEFAVHEADMKDEDGILIGVKYIEKVLLRLDSITM